MSAITDITHTLAIFGLGGGEMAAIFIIVLLLFGAKKLPELARGIGKSTGEFKRARDEFEREIKSAEADAEREKAVKDAQAAAAIAPPTAIAEQSQANPTPVPPVDTADKA